MTKEQIGYAVCGNAFSQSLINAVRESGNNQEPKVLAEEFAQGDLNELGVEKTEAEYVDWVNQYILNFILG